MKGGGGIVQEIPVLLFCKTCFETLILEMRKRVGRYLASLSGWIFFGIAAMPFLCNGLLLIQFNLTRFNLVFTLITVASVWNTGEANDIYYRGCWQICSENGLDRTFLIIN